MKSWKIIVSLVLSAMLLSAGFLYAEKERVAILDFDAYNTPKSIAKVVTDMVSAKVFETKIFTIVERNQIKEIMKEMELQQTGCTDASCAVEVGKMLSAQKIVTGNVLKLDTLNIVTKVIDVGSGKVEGNYRVEAMSDTDLEGATLAIVDSIRDDFRTSMYLSTSISGGYLMSLGDFSRTAKQGFGANLDLNANNFFMKNMILSLSAGAYNFSGAEDSIESILMVPGTVTLGYSFKLMRNLKITPRIGGGILMHMMSYDADGIDQAGNYEYASENFYDGTVMARVDIDMSISASWSLFVSPAYYYFFEKEKAGQLTGGNFGLRMFF